jgi:hypothetical protein
MHTVKFSEGFAGDFLKSLRLDDPTNKPQKISEPQYFFMDNLDREMW